MARTKNAADAAAAAAAETVTAVRGPDALYETYRYAPGPPAESPLHAHADYNLCLSPDFPGEYRYRGARHPVPVGSLSVLHPGEVHGSRDRAPRPHATTFHLVYLSPDRVRAFARDLADAAGRGRRAAVAAGGAPFFADPILTDPELVARFSRAHRLGMAAATAALERDTALADAVAALLARHGWGGSEPTPRRAVSERAAVRAAREYLDAHCAGEVPLARLAAVAGLSPYYLNRVFRAEVGLPPHAYQVQARVDLARRLLAAGLPPGAAAQEAGFCDQSHLTRHFRRIVGVTPGRYATRRPRG